MSTNREFDLVEVFAGTAMEAEMVRSLLNDAEVEVFIKDGHMGTMFPFHTAPGAAGSVKVIVSNLDYAKAKLIVEDYYKNINSTKEQ